MDRQENCGYNATYQFIKILLHVANHLVTHRYCDSETYWENMVERM